MVLRTYWSWILLFLGFSWIADSMTLHCISAISYLLVSTESILLTVPLYDLVNRFAGKRWEYSRSINHGWQMSSCINHSNQCFEEMLSCSNSKLLCMTMLFFVVIYYSVDAIKITSIDLQLAILTLDLTKPRLTRILWDYDA